MISLIVFGVAIAYVATFWFVIAKARNRAERISAIVIALLIPFWDFPIGIAYFYYRCSQESGLQISTDLRAVDSILIGEHTAYRPEDALKLGFKTVEYRYRGDILRFSFDSSGLKKAVHSELLSSYVFDFSDERNLPWNLIRSEYFVKSINDGKVVAKQTDFSWRGMWWEVSSRIHVTSFRHCSSEPTKSLLAVLKSGA